MLQDPKEIERGKRLVQTQIVRSFTGPTVQVGGRLVGMTATRWLLDHAQNLVESAYQAVRLLGIVEALTTDRPDSECTREQLQYRRRVVKVVGKWGGK